LKIICNGSHKQVISMKGYTSLSEMLSSIMQFSRNINSILNNTS